MDLLEGAIYMLCYPLTTYAVAGAPLVGPCNGRRCAGISQRPFVSVLGQTSPSVNS